MNDDKLASLAAARDGAAFSELVNRHQGVVRGFLRRLARDTSTADDIAQETFLRAYQHVAKYRGPDRFRSWLISIAYREFLAHRKAQQRWSAALLFGRGEKAPAGAEDEEKVAAEPVAPGSDFAGPLLDAMALNQALEALPPAPREAILLCEVHGFSQTEAASLMALPLGTVKSHLLRGRARLRRALVEQEEAGVFDSDARITTGDKAYG